MSSKRRFSREFKLAAVRRVQAGELVARLARELEVNPSELYRWFREQERFGAHAFMGTGHQRVGPDRVAELERKIGQQALEIDFLKRALQRVEEQRQLRALYGGAQSTNRLGGKPKPNGA
jgi:transposase-like protein